MKRFTCMPLLLGAVLAAIALPSTAQAAVEISYFRGKTADVEFFSTDPTGCKATSVIVTANESRYFSPQAPQESHSAVDVNIGLYNTCTGEIQVCALGSIDLPAGAFNVTPLSTSATLNVTGEIHDNCTHTDRPVTLALTWTGTGELLWGRSFSSQHSPGQQVLYRQSGQLRDAAVTGSITLDGAPLTLGTGTGTISKASNGTITRIH